METLRRLRMAAEAIDKDVTVRSERIGQTRDFRVSLWFREKAMEQGFIAWIHHPPARAATKRAECHVIRSAPAF